MKFLGAQHGEPENEFKCRVIETVQRRDDIDRCYLGRVRHRALGKKRVFIGLAGSMEHRTEVVAVVESIFKEMFRTTESLDIILLDDELEHDLRKTQYPFYTRRSPVRPDFYMATLETRGLETVRECYVERTLVSERSGQFVLCEVQPALPSTLSTPDLRTDPSRVILSSRHAGYSVCNVIESFVGVHVCFVPEHFPTDCLFVPWNPETRRSSDAWAEIHPSRDAAQQWVDGE